MFLGNTFYGHHFWCHLCHCVICVIMSFVSLCPRIGTQESFSKKILGLKKIQVKKIGLQKMLVKKHFGLKILLGQLGHHPPHPYYLYR